MGDSFIFDDDESRQSSFTDIPEGGPSEGGGEEGPPEGSNNRTFLIAAGILGGVILLALICMAGYAFFLMPRQNAAQNALQTAVLLTNTSIAGGATGTAQALLATATLDPASIAATSQAVAATRQMAATMTASAIAAAASPTPVVVFFTATPVVETATPDPVTETVAALYTQAAQAELTAAITPVFAKIKASSGNNITVYIEPNGATLGSLANGVQVEVLPEQQDINGTTWVKIRFTNAQGQTTEGWVIQSQLITVTPIAGAVPTTGFADQVGLPGLFIIGFVLIVIILLARRLRSAPERLP
jgi:hypothetical protein